MSRKLMGFVAHPAFIAVFFVALAACRPDFPCG